MSHFGHFVTALEMASVLVLTGVVIAARTISSRPGIGRRDATFLVGRVDLRDIYFRAGRRDAC